LRQRSDVDYPPTPTYRRG